ncbi:MAG: sensor histidine kinase [Gemmatimonadaceae bacterium]|nr:sensor histidine kinase [Gemmatimonadaceae bacterium]
MQLPLTAASVELDAAILQVAVAAGLTAYAGSLYRRYRKPHFAWFASAWALYLLRLLCIMAFLITQQSGWLYWHQVVTGWTALALLWSALVFSRQLQFKPAYLAALLFPLGWSVIAIFVMRDFFWAALPAVVFLSFVTFWTAAVFYRHWERTRVRGARFLAVALFLWALHHLDYPFLRARGAWNPWGYYLDIIFLLCTGVGLTYLVLDELKQGFTALTSLAATTSTVAERDDLEVLLGQALSLPATRGAALLARAGRETTLVRGVGECAPWASNALPPTAIELADTAIATGAPRVTGAWTHGAARASLGFAYGAALPIPRATAGTAALVLVGDVRNPFTALDDAFLIALGQQLGAALDAAELTRRLRARTADLTRLSARMIEQHEEERRRISLELHDETAQVFSAVKLQLGLLRERTSGNEALGVERALALVDEGMRSIRNVTETLRPTVLDDLGLVPAMRSLAVGFEGQCGIEVTLDAPEPAPHLSEDAELALFRAMQEALSNVARHAPRAQHVWASLREESGALVLDVRDDGLGSDAPLDRERLERLEREGHMGLAGMRERIGSLGGTVTLAHAAEGGVRVTICVPLRAIGAA